MSTLTSSNEEIHEDSISQKSVENKISIIERSSSKDSLQDLSEEIISLKNNSSSENPFHGSTISRKSSGSSKSSKKTIKSIKASKTSLSSKHRQESEGAKLSKQGSTKTVEGDVDENEEEDNDFLPTQELEGSSEWVQKEDFGKEFEKNLEPGDEATWSRRYSTLWEAQRTSVISIGKKPFRQASTRQTSLPEEDKLQQDDSGDESEGEEVKASRVKLTRKDSTIRQSVDLEKFSAHRPSNLSLLQSYTSSIMSSNKKKLSEEIRKLHAMKPRTSGVSATTRVFKKDKTLKAKEVPTYQLGPRVPFSTDIVTKLIVDFQHFAKAKMPTYKADMADSVATAIAAQLRTAVAGLHFNRYKICVMVIIGEKKYEGYHCDCRCLWAKEYDGLAFWTIENSTYFLQLMCFGLYKD